MPDGRSTTNNEKYEMYREGMNYSRPLFSFLWRRPVAVITPAFFSLASKEEITPLVHHGPVGTAGLPHLVGSFRPPYFLQ